MPRPASSPLPPRPIYATQSRSCQSGSGPSRLSVGLVTSSGGESRGGRLPPVRWEIVVLTSRATTEEGEKRHKKGGKFRWNPADCLIQHWLPVHSRHTRYISSNDMIMALAVFVSLSGHFGDVVIYLFQTQPSTPACCPTTLQFTARHSEFQMAPIFLLMAQRSGWQAVGEGGPRDAACCGSPIRGKEVGAERFRASQQ